VEYIRSRTKDEYRTLAAGSREDGKSRAARSASAREASVPMRKARWAVTGAAAWLEAQRAAQPRQAAPGRIPLETAAPGSLDEATFGTLCHMFIESLLKTPGLSPEPRGSVLRSLEALGTTARTSVEAKALELARTFLDSPRGQEAAQAQRDARTVPGTVFETEFPFVWQAGEDRPVVLSGAMDLVYGNQEGVVVIDFKTDQTVQPAKHQFQLSVYRDAAASIFGVGASAFLWYLRSGQEHRIDGDPDISLLGQPGTPDGSMD